MFEAHRSPLTAIEVCNAALMEVGHPARATVDQHGQRRVQSIGDLTLSRRAVALGIMSEHGPDHLIMCEDCIREYRRTRSFIGVCTTARDVLRGVRCGRRAISPTPTNEQDTPS